MLFLWHKYIKNIPQNFINQIDVSSKDFSSSQINQWFQWERALFRNGAIVVLGIQPSDLDTSLI